MNNLHDIGLGKLNFQKRVYFYSMQRQRDMLDKRPNLG
jgi:hypothetical protein